MAFDLSTAKPANQPPQVGGFDMSTAKPVPEQPERSGLDYLSHISGVGARGVVKGIASIPDTPENVINLAEAGMSNLTGKEPHYLPTPVSSGAESLLNAMHFPTADSDGEKILQTATTGLGGGAAFGPIGAASGATGGASQQMAANNGVGPVGQFAAGMAGGMAPIAAVTLANAGKRAVMDAINPATDANVGRIMAAPLRKPGEVLDMLKRGPEEYVPGSIPTSAETAMDNDLIASQQSFLNQNPKYKGDLQNRNVAAQNEHISEIAKTPADLAAAEQARTATTTPLYEAAKGDLLDAKAIQPVLARIDQEIAGVGAHSEAGQRLLALKDKIQQSLPQMVENKSPILDAEGNAISTPQFKNPQQGPLVQIYKEQRDAANKTGMQDGAYGAAVKGVVKPVIRELGDALEGQSPNLAAANSKFRNMSGPIDQMEALQNIKERVFKGGQNISGNQAPRLAALDSILSNEGRAELAKILTPEQMQRLDNLQGDLRRQSTLSSVKASGSDTASMLKADKMRKDVASSAASYFLGKIPIVGGLIKSLGGKIEMRGSDLLDNALGRAYTDVPYAAQVLEAGMKSPDTIKGQIMNNLSASAKGSGMAALPKDLSSALDEKGQKKERRKMK